MGEPLTERWIERCPNTDRVAIDVGANEGKYTAWMAQRFNHVYAIEPHLEIFKQYSLRNVTFINKAIERPGPLSPAVARDSSFVSITFDALWQEIKARNQTIGLIKCDIEGAEDFAWDNAGDLLKDNYEWLWIILELHEGVRMPRLHKFFLESGYSWSSDYLYHNGHYLLKKENS